MAFVALLTAGCSSAQDLKKVCIPEVDCAAIDTIEAPANCQTCVDCQDNWGACSPGGAACKRGALDLDSRVVGCEAQTTDAHGQWVMHSTGQATSFFSFNGALFQLQMSVSVLAYDEDDASCIPSVTKSCGYTLHAMQLEVPYFTIPESSWSSGVATLNGPVAASDDAGAAGALASMQFAFEVQQGSQRRIALSSALVSVSVAREMDPDRASITVELDTVDFGGYKITNLYLNGELGTL